MSVCVQISFCVPACAFMLLSEISLPKLSVTAAHRVGPELHNTQDAIEMARTMPLVRPVLRAIGGISMHASLAISLKLNLTLIKARPEASRLD